MRSPDSTAQPLAIEGALTIYNAAESKPLLLAAVQQPGPLEVDLARVDELDCAGLQLLLQMQREAGEHGCALLFSHPTPAVLEVLELSGLGRLLGETPA